MHRLLLVMIVLLALPWYGSALAEESNERFVLNEERLQETRSFDPILTPALTTILVAPTYDQCRYSSGMLAIPVTLAFQRDFGFRVRFTLDWQSEGTDYDFFLFDDSGEPLDESYTGDVPEEMTLANPANGDYYLCVANYSGAAPYEITAAASFLDLYEPPERTPRPSPTSSASPTPTPAPTAAAETVASEPPITTPGPDGTVAPQQLVALSGQASPPDDGVSGLQIALLGATIGVAALGLGVVTLRIRREMH